MSALDTLLAKCATDAHRVALLREALEIANSEVEAYRVDAGMERAAFAKLARTYGKTWGERVAMEGRSQNPGEEIAKAIEAWGRDEAAQPVAHFACGRCAECDGGRGYEHCLAPRIAPGVTP